MRALRPVIEPLVPKGEALRRAVAWLVAQKAWSPALVQEACQRFDISPADEEFLIAECRKLHAHGKQ